MKKLEVGDEFMILQLPKRRVFKSNEEYVDFNLRMTRPGNHHIQIKHVYIDKFVAIAFREPGRLIMIHRSAFDDEENLFDPITL